MKTPKVDSKLRNFANSHKYTFKCTKCLFQNFIKHMKFTFLGQNGFIIEFGGKTLVVDPFITGNPLSEGKIDPSKITADYVLLTHGHGDHISDAELIASMNDATIISNYEIATHYGSKGLKNHPMNHGGKYEFDFGMVKYVNAVHSSSFPDGSFAGQPGGFVIWNDEQCFYIAGDTALTMDMKLIPMTCPKLDLAVMPIGDNFTMGYEDAAIAAEFVDCDQIIGCHYDTFGYIEIDKSAASLAFERKGKKLHLLDINDSIDF